MMNIFSSFNPSNMLFMFFLILNCFIFFIPLMNKMKLKLNMIKLNVIKFLNNDYNKNNNSTMSIYLLIILFYMNSMMNLMNLLPFSFCLNSQLNIFFFISFFMWLSCISYSLNLLFKKTICHLTPESCPMMISPFMVMIEIISMLIRPVTLSVRMSANLLAGHLLIHLLTEFSFFLINIKVLNLILSLMLMLTLNILEIAVALIQPYIFCTLINMYLCENK